MISLRVGLGIAVGSLAAYGLVLAGKPQAWVLGPIATGVLSGFALPCSRERWQWPRPLAAILVGISAAGAAAVATFILGEFPTGAWDAVEIWDHRAVSMLRKGIEEGLAGVHRHQDYPLLVPLTVLEVWEVSRALPAPAMVGALFGLLTVGLPWEGVHAQGGADRGAIAGGVLLATPLFAFHALSHRADVPLGFFVLAAVVALDRREFVAAGLALGAAAWTKNEGLLIAGVGICAVTWLSRGNLGRVVAGSAPFGIAIAVHRQMAGTSGDLVGGQGLETLTRVADPDRWLQVGWAFANELALYLAILAGLVYVLGARGELRRGAIAGAALVGVTLAGYAGVYLMTPHDVAWHLDSSLSRILLHLWPAALYVVTSR
jgi:hypothetical protein